MEARSVNFNQIQLSEEKIDKIKDRLKGYEEWIQSSIKYAKVEEIIFAEKEIEDSFKRAIQEIKTQYDSIKKKINIDFISDNYEGTHWIERSIKKQLYYFLTDERLPKNYKYEPNNPLTNARIQQEIIDRAIGWDYWCNYCHGEKPKWSEDETIRKLLEKDEYRSSFDFPRKYQLREGQLSSWALAKLGKRLRELSGANP